MAGIKFWKRAGCGVRPWAIGICVSGIRAVIWEGQFEHVIIEFGLELRNLEMLARELR
jgi:hypothetical protein